MDPKEALQGLMDAITDIENYDEHFKALSGLISGTDVVGMQDETDWKSKYEDLHQKYRDRFREEIFGGESGLDSKRGLDAIEETMNEEEQIPELRDLDFDGRSE